MQHQIRSAAFSMSKRSPRDLLRVTVAGAVGEKIGVDLQNERCSVVRVVDFCNPEAVHFVLQRCAFQAEPFRSPAWSSDFS